jgi:hypothetical protein
MVYVFTSKQGSETDIRMKSYVMLFTQEYNEDDESVEWKLADYKLNGDVPWL